MRGLTGRLCFPQNYNYSKDLGRQRGNRHEITHNIEKGGCCALLIQPNSLLLHAVFCETRTEFIVCSPLFPSSRVFWPCQTRASKLSVLLMSCFPTLSTILTAIINHLHNSIQEDTLSIYQIKQVMEHIWKLQEFCNRMAKLDIGSYEYTYLKVIVLFSPEHPRLTEQAKKFQEKAQMESQGYIQKTYLEHTYQLAQILVCLPASRFMGSNPCTLR